MADQNKYDPKVLQEMIPKEHYKKGNIPYLLPLFGTLFRNRLNAVIGKSVQHLPPQGEYDILEVGSGFGQFTTLLGTHYPNSRIFALDIMAAGLPYILRLADRYKVKYVAPVQGDAMTLPFASERFDAVFSMDTLEHVPDPEIALEHIKRVLRPNGILFVMVPVEAVWLRTARAMYWKVSNEWYPPYHWQGTIKNVNSFSNLMHNHFDIIEEFHYPLPGLWRELNYERIIFAQKK